MASNKTGNLIQIDLARLKKNMQAIAQFGGGPSGQGITRPSFSEADMAARRWLMSEMAAIGLVTHMDGVGNVFGRWEIGNGPAILTGSHIDSVPNGGLFDGTLGVLAGVEAIQAMMDAGITPDCPIEIVATSEEEGRFGGMLGSEALTGNLTREWLLSAQDSAGKSLKDAMAEQGLNVLDALDCLLRPDQIKAFLELHIEQGPVLESRNIPVGIVEGITGCVNWKISIEGMANHAGTTPMDLRADAFAGTAEFAVKIPNIIKSHGSPQSRLTIGKIDIFPNFPHTIPGKAEFSLIVRDMKKSVMKSLCAACKKELEYIADNKKLKVSVQQASWLDPQHCNSEIMELLQNQAGLLAIDTLQMPSGAGHDTQFMAKIAPSGLIFVPSIDGISHNPEENTNWSDIEKGTNLLTNSLATLSRNTTVLRKHFP